jgi:hypothetical protein
MIVGRKSFIEEILQRLKDTDRKEISYRKTLHASAIDLDDLVALVAARFKISKEKALTSSPYRNYAVCLSKKHTALSNPQIGAYFGNLLCGDEDSEPVGSSDEKRSISKSNHGEAGKEVVLCQG